MNDTKHLVDVHHHILPPLYTEALDRIGIRGATPPWNVDDTLALMDRQGIDIAIASVPGVSFGDAAFNRDLARRCNDYSAELMQSNPSRFGALGSLPLPDLDVTFREVEYIFDTLALNGVLLPARVGARYAGDPEWDALMAELNRRRAVVLLHPSAASQDELPEAGLPPGVAEFTCDTTRAIANLIFTGTLERYPDLRIIAAHAGGTVPLLPGRFQMAEAQVPDVSIAAPQGSAAYLKHLYYDTAVAATPEIFHALKQIADPAHVLFGTDHPNLPEAAIAESIRQVREQDAFEGATTIAIERSNALALFPYLDIKGMTG